MAAKRVNRAATPAVREADPVSRFEHTHTRLNRLALDVAESVRRLEDGATEKVWKETIRRLEALRDELLQHFADEEEALFPFVRARVGARAGAVQRLEAAHDNLCGAVVRAHAAACTHHKGLLTTLHRRFQDAYVEHSCQEAELFDGLGEVLDARQRAELGDLLRGL
jgi:iron-sulfur cluster repair protein YtfE (RIC family)